LPLSEGIPLSFLSQSLKYSERREVASVDTQESPETSPIPGKQVDWFFASNATSLTFLFQATMPGKQENFKETPVLL